MLHAPRSLRLSRTVLATTDGMRMDTSKIQQELAWEPRKTLLQVLVRTVRWYLENPQWVEHVTSGTYQRERLGPRCEGDKMSNTESFHKGILLAGGLGTRLYP